MKIEPTKLKGILHLPPSKSIAHRVLICSALAGMKLSETAKNICLSDDIAATLHGMNILTKQNEPIILNCMESGSTLRFLIPLSLALGRGGRFIGHGNLGKRPLNSFYPIFQKCGISYECKTGFSERLSDDIPFHLQEDFKESTLDFMVKGKLLPGNYEISGNSSSQFISGLFFALPLLDGDSTVTVTTELVSKGYVDLTRQVLENFGIFIENREDGVFEIRGNRKYSAVDYKIEGDYSHASFFLCANALGSEIEIDNLKIDSFQGDKVILEALEKIKVANEKETLIIDGSSCPDILPSIALAAAVKENCHTQIIKAPHLRVKESDRIAAVSKELNKLGAKIEERGDGFDIFGVKDLKGGCSVWSHKDHRIAMMLAIASTACKEPITLEDSGCVSKSYPTFFEDFKRLGGIFYGK